MSIIREELKDELPPLYEEAVRHDSEAQKHYEALIALQKEQIESLKRQLIQKEKKEPIVLNDYYYDNIKKDEQKKQKINNFVFFKKENKNIKEYKNKDEEISDDKRKERIIKDEEVSDEEVSDKRKERINKMKKERELQRKYDIKKNVPPFILFCHDKRVQLKKEHPELSSKEFAQFLGRVWQIEKTYDTDEFRKYQELARKDKLRFQEEINTSMWFEKCRKL